MRGSTKPLTAPRRHQRAPRKQSDRPHTEQGSSLPLPQTTSKSTSPFFRIRIAFKRFAPTPRRRDPSAPKPACTTGLSEVLPPNHVVPAGLVDRVQIPALEVPPVGQQQVSFQGVGRRKVRALRCGVRGQRYLRRTVLQQIHRHVQLHRRRTASTKPPRILLGQRVVDRETSSRPG